MYTRERSRQAADIEDGGGEESFKFANLNEIRNLPKAGLRALSFSAAATNSSRARAHLRHRRLYFSLFLHCSPLNCLSYFLLVCCPLFTPSRSHSHSRVLPFRSLALFPRHIVCSLSFSSYPSPRVFSLILFVSRLALFHSCARVSCPVRLDFSFCSLMPCAGSFCVLLPPRPLLSYFLLFPHL